MDAWPWLAVAGFGAAHGLHPASGWMFAVGCGQRAAGRRPLLAVALGHAVSVGFVACAAAQGLVIDRTLAQRLAGVLLICAAVPRLLRGATAPHRPVRPIRSTAGIALWSGLMATAHGAGLMLVPALASVCLQGSPARALTASGSWPVALAAVGLHLGAMLATAALVAKGVNRVLDARGTAAAFAGHAWGAGQAAVGLCLLAFT